MDVLAEEFGTLSQEQLLAPVDTVEVRGQTGGSHICLCSIDYMLHEIDS